MELVNPMVTMSGTYLILMFHFTTTKLFPFIPEAGDPGWVNIAYGENKELKMSRL